MLFLWDESDVIMILGPPSIGKNTTIHSIKKMVVNLLHGYVLCLGTTGIASFVIAGSAGHSALLLPISREF